MPPENPPEATERRALRLILPLRHRLTASIVVVVLAMGGVSILVGTRLFVDGLLAQVQQSVEQDLNTAQLVYEGRLGEIRAALELVAEEDTIGRDLAEGRAASLAERITERMERIGLDALTVTDARGSVIARGNRPVEPPHATRDEIVERVIAERRSVAGTVIEPAAELARESPELAARARIELVETPRARPTGKTVLEDGLMLKAGVPIEIDGRIVGTLSGGLLLSRDERIVDRVKATAYRGETWKGSPIGTATIFQDDVRIATNVLGPDGKRAIGTRVSEEVYRQVVEAGKPWIARAFVVDDWYITAYRPLLDPGGEVVGILYVGVLAEPFDAARRRVVLTFAVVIVAGMVLAFVIASLLSGGIVKPLRHLADAAREIASGRFGTRVDVDPLAAGGELRELGDAFNFMAKSIEERDSQLQENARKMTESKKLATLGRLAAGIAHEINNPLGGIVMYSHMLREDLKRPENRENVEKIGHEADRCKRIVKGLLDFARQTKPERTESNINHVLNEVIALLEHQAIFHNIDIVKNHSPGVPLVDVDVAQMQEVFMNIILNAAQAMEGKGTLSTMTRLADDKRTIEIEIRDTGPGIPPESLDKVFEPFFTTKEVGRGTGLGLSIAYGIVERHHGTIRVESEVGKGTSFVIGIPVAEPPPEM